MKNERDKKRNMKKKYITKQYQIIFVYYSLIISIVYYLRIYSVTNKQM